MKPIPPNHFSRRTLIKGSALLFGTTLVDVRIADAIQKTVAKTPALTASEILAIETAIGKKGTYKDAEATHTTPFPRNDLKVTLKGGQVPIPFGFGGWMSIKRTIDGKSAVLMSDCVLLQEEVNPLISAAQANGLEIGAIHNHFFYEEPAYFLCTYTGWTHPKNWQRNMLLR